MHARKMLSLVSVLALLAIPGCATDDAVKKDAKNAQPKVEKAGKDAEKAGADAADAVDDNDSK
jgi:hypothetical protein